MYAYIKVISDKGYKEAGHRLTVPSIEDYQKNKAYYQQLAITKLCIARNWTIKDLYKYGYNKIIVYFREENI